ncbi:MAG TPA: hypothetical protein VKR06_21195 [Ktedonosporobacter sp.]|nr:hypothetical protein [Ktedonosporobacter sp.]
MVISAVLALTGFWLAGCSLPAGSGGANGTPAPQPVKLAQLHWCGKSLMLFRDEGAPPIGGTTPANASTPVVASSPTTITNWGQVKADLGFTLFLPATLPEGTCLVSASGTVHDPIFGGSFTISFLLANHDSISLSEAPWRSQNTAFQCSITTNETLSGIVGGTPTGSTAATVASAKAPIPVQLCTGVREKTNIVFSARGTADALQTFFHDLQPDVDWMPA